jgi:transcriptional regulator with XRE-family HTH domain
MDPAMPNDTPDVDVDFDIGRQLKKLRGKDITQRDLAERAGISLVLVQKLEQGARQASLATLYKLARALDVEIGELLGQKTSLPEPTEDAGVVAIRHAITSIDDLLTERAAQRPPATTEGMRRTVTYAWGAFRSGRYDLLGKVLPNALLDTRTIELVDETADLATQLYEVAGSALVYLGHPDAAHVAIREAIRLADGGTDPLRLVALRDCLSWLLLKQGRYAESYELAMATAADVTPGSRDELPRMVLWGKLLVRGATAAVRAGDGAQAHHLLGEAQDIARHTGHRNSYETTFGPDLVTMRTVDVHVVAQDYTTALKAAEAMPKDSTLSLTYRARHLEDRAVAHTWLGHDERAVDILEEMVRLAPPVWNQHQTQSKILVRELRERQRRVRTSARLKDLAQKFHVAG